MLRVRTYLCTSPIHGIGLFAAEDIPRGTVIWKFDGLDLVFPPSVLERLDPVAVEQLKNYAYLDPKQGGYVLCADDGRFMNHADTPNTRETETTTVAAEDIKIDDEITCDYRRFDASWKERDL